MEQKCHVCNRTMHIVCQGCGRPACPQHSEVLVRCAECGERIRVGVVEQVREQINDLQKVVASLRKSNEKNATDIVDVQSHIDDVLSTLNVESVEEDDAEEVGPHPGPDDAKWDEAILLVEGGETYRGAAKIISEKYGIDTSHTWLWKRHKNRKGKLPKPASSTPASGPLDEPDALLKGRWGLKKAVTYIIEKVDESHPGEEIVTTQITDIAENWKNFRSRYKNHTSFQSSVTQMISKKLVGKKINGKVLHKLPRSGKTTLNSYRLVAGKTTKTKKGAKGKKKEKKVSAKKVEEHEQYVDNLIDDIEGVLATDERKHIGIIVDDLMKSSPYSEQKKSSLASSVFQYTKQMMHEKMSSNYPNRRIRSEHKDGKHWFWSVEVVPHESSDKGVNSAKEYGKMLEESFK